MPPQNATSKFKKQKKNVTHFPFLYLFFHIIIQTKRSTKARQCTLPMYWYYPTKAISNNFLIKQTTSCRVCLTYMSFRRGAKRLIPADILVMGANLLTVSHILHRGQNAKALLLTAGPHSLESLH